MDRRRRANWTAFSMHRPPPTDEDVAELCRTIRDRTLRPLQRRGLLETEETEDSQEEPLLAHLR